MRTISAVQAQVGDVVAEPVVNDHGRTLLPKGARLSPAVLSRLEGWGVAELCIEAEEEAPAASDEDATADEADLLAALDHRFSGWEEDAYDDAHQGYRSPPLGIVASRLRRHFRGQRQARPRTATRNAYGRGSNSPATCLHYRGLLPGLSRWSTTNAPRRVSLGRKSPRTRSSRRKCSSLSTPDSMVFPRSYRRSS